MNRTCDFHIDVPWQLHKQGRYDLSQRWPDVDVDYPRMKEGGLYSAFFALYLSDAEQDRLGNYESTEAIWRQILYMEQMTSPEIDIFYGLEGGRLIHHNLQQLYAYWSAGVKYLTLTHNKNNDICDSATDQPKCGALTDFGEQLVASCELLNILVDVSHASDGSTDWVLSTSCRPVVATHSGCRTITNHQRNLPDYLIKRLCKTGGVIGIPFAKRFVGNTRGIIDHIDHVCQIAGDCEHVGIGSDLDGAQLVTDISGVQDWSKVVCEGLADAGYVDDNIELIAGENILRLFDAKS